MIKIEKKQYWTVGLILTILSFILFFVGVKFVLGNDVNLKNIIAYGGFSILVGVISAILVFFRFQIAFLGFIFGLVIGLAAIAGSVSGRPNFCPIYLSTAMSVSSATRRNPAAMIARKQPGF